MIQEISNIVSLTFYRGLDFGRNHSDPLWSRPCIASWDSKILNCNPSTRNIKVIYGYHQINFCLVALNPNHCQIFWGIVLHIHVHPIGKDVWMIFCHIRQYQIRYSIEQQYRTKKHLNLQMWINLFRVQITTADNFDL